MLSMFLSFRQSCLASPLKVAGLLQRRGKLCSPALYGFLEASLDWNV